MCAAISISNQKPTLSNAKCTPSPGRLKERSKSKLTARWTKAAATVSKKLFFHILSFFSLFFFGLLSKVCCACHASRATAFFFNTNVARAGRLAKTRFFFLLTFVIHSHSRTQIQRTDLMSIYAAITCLQKKRDTLMRELALINQSIQTKHQFVYKANCCAIHLWQTTKEAAALSSGELLYLMRKKRAFFLCVC
jgi:hypothetical protein